MLDPRLAADLIRLGRPPHLGLVPPPPPGPPLMPGLLPLPPPTYYGPVSAWAQQRDLALALARRDLTPSPKAQGKATKSKTFWRTILERYWRA